MRFIILTRTSHQEDNRMTSNGKFKCEQNLLLLPVVETGSGEEMEKVAEVKLRGGGQHTKRLLAGNNKFGSNGRKLSGR